MDGGNLKIDPFLIDFNWLERDFGDGIERASFADLTLAAGRNIITRLEDRAAKTVRPHLRGSAYQLAHWFAANWWRLRWEPEPSRWSPDTDWRLSHCIAAAGHGYIWPDATFASDGEFCDVFMRGSAADVVFEPIRYLDHFHARVSAQDFEEKVSAFIEAVLSRLETLGVCDELLSPLWREIQAERQDADATKQRKLEAMAGYDPDEAPDGFLETLTAGEAALGRSAVEEVAAQFRHSADSRLADILRLRPSSTGPQPGGFRASIPSFDLKDQNPVSGQVPWRQAAWLAEHVRAQWGLDQKPISDSVLANLVGIKKSTLTGKLIVTFPIPLAFREEGGNQVDMYLDRPHVTTRRFTVSRLIGDFLSYRNRETLIPATKAKTARQKFQRAFAQEFLCPIDALVGKIQTISPDDDDYAAAAEYFGVSLLTVATTLVNHGKLAREALAYIE